LTPELVFVVAAAFAAGLVDAMAGGGGLITTPALFAALPQTPHTDLLGTSKVASLSGSLSAVARYARHVRFDWPLLRRAAIGAFIAALAGAWLATRVSPLHFRALVPVLLAVVLVYTLLQRDFGRGRAQHVVPHRPALTIACAAVIGGYDGFFKTILRLRKGLKTPHALPGLIKGLDMDRKRKTLIAEMAIVDPTAGGNPVKLTKKAALGLLEAALAGEV